LLIKGQNQINPYQENSFCIKATAAVTSKEEKDTYPFYFTHPVKRDHSSYGKGKKRGQINLLDEPRQRLTRKKEKQQELKETLSESCHL